MTVDVISKLLSCVYGSRGVCTSSRSDVRWLNERIIVCAWVILEERGGVAEWRGTTNQSTDSQVWTSAVSAAMFSTFSL